MGKLQGSDFPQLPKGSSNKLVEPVCRIRVLRVVPGIEAGPKAATGIVYRSERWSWQHDPNGRACCRSLRKVAFASNRFPVRIRKAVWQR